MKKHVCLLITILLSLTACSSQQVSHFPSYKLKVVQGNEVDEATLNQITVGATKQQVQALIGTPLLQDPFHQNRWDYVFTISRNGIISEERTITFYFDSNDTVIDIKGNFAAEAEAGKK